VDEDEMLRKRAERFNIVDEDDAKRKRAERFKTELDNVYEDKDIKKTKNSKKGLRLRKRVGLRRNALIGGKGMKVVRDKRGGRRLKRQTFKERRGGQTTGRRGRGGFRRRKFIN
jgi:hypothetical protein